MVQDSEFCPVVFIPLGSFLEIYICFNYELIYYLTCKSSLPFYEIHCSVTSRSIFHISKTPILLRLYVVRNRARSWLHREVNWKTGLTRSPQGHVETVYLAACLRSLLKSWKCIHWFWEYGADVEEHFVHSWHRSIRDAVLTPSSYSLAGQTDI